RRQAHREHRQRLNSVTRFIALLTLVSGLHASAWAQYPTRPIRLVVPAAPGGGTDIVTRSVVPALSENLGQTVVIENRGGAGGVIGSDLVAKAAPDGYTLLMVYASHATNPTLNKTLPYDTLRDFAPITLMTHEPTLLVTHPSVPAKTPQAVIERVNDAAQKALKNEAVLARLAASGTQPIGAGPEGAAAHIRAEMARWDRVLKAAGVQPN